MRFAHRQPARYDQHQSCGECPQRIGPPRVSPGRIGPGANACQAYVALRSAVDGNEDAPIVVDRDERVLADARVVHGDACEHDDPRDDNDSDPSGEHRPQRNRSGDVRFGEGQTEEDSTDSPSRVGQQHRREHQRHRQGAELQERSHTTPAEEQQYRDGGGGEQALVRRAAHDEVR